MYLITSITMLSLFLTTFLTMKKSNRVVFQSMRSGAVHHNGAQCCMRDFCFFFTLFPPPLQKIRKKICCEGYSKACSRTIWLWSLSKYVVVSTSYIFFIKIGQAVFKKNHFLNFSFPLHNS